MSLCILNGHHPVVDRPGKGAYAGEIVTICAECGKTMDRKPARPVIDDGNIKRAIDLRRARSY